MESWRKVWRDGLMPQMSIKTLRALGRGLERDDMRLTQGASSVPPPLEHLLDWPIEGACVVGYGAWQSASADTVGDIETLFAESCLEADRRLGEPAAVRYFLNWYDDVPRDEMRRELLAEVKRELSRRSESRAVTPAARRAEFAAA